MNQVRRAIARPLRRLSDVLVDRTAHIERRHLQRIRIREIEPDQRVHQGERLDGLERIEIKSLLLVGNIEPGTHNRHAPHAPSSPSRGVDASKRVLHRKIDPDGGVRREPALAVHARSLGELESRIAERLRLLDETGIGLGFSRRALDHRKQPRANRAATLQRLTRIEQPLVRSRLRECLLEIVQTCVHRAVDFVAVQLSSRDTRMACKRGAEEQQVDD